jgi:hypothetical protein
MSIQKYYKERCNKVLRGYLFTVTIFYNVKLPGYSADFALCGSQGNEQCRASEWCCHWVHFWCLFLIEAVNFEVLVTGCIDCGMWFAMQQQGGSLIAPMIVFGWVLHLVCHHIDSTVLYNGLAVCLLNQSCGVAYTLPQLCCEWAPVVCAS